MAFIWPDGTTTMPRVTSEFGPRKHPVTGKQQGQHNGIDLAGPKNRPQDWTVIVSPVAGFVTRNEYQAGGAGNWIEIREHATGDRFRFFHLKARSPHAVGTWVPAGTAIGVMGMTGTATQVHLHFETRPGGGSPIDPRDYYARRQTGSVKAEAAPRPREELDPMLYACATTGTPYVVYGHNGGWATVAFTPEDKNSEYYSIVKKIGDPIWLAPQTLNHLIEDSRGNVNSTLLAEVRELVATEKAAKK